MANRGRQDQGTLLAPRPLSGTMHPVPYNTVSESFDVDAQSSVPIPMEGT